MHIDKTTYILQYADDTALTAHGQIGKLQALTNSTIT